MSTPQVVLRIPGGRAVSLGPGDIIGRLRSAACRLVDPRVSEAHALVSLRGSELRLVALRGEVRVGGRVDDDFALAAGQRVALAEGVELLVESVTVPGRVLAVRIGEEAPRELWAPVYSMVYSPLPELVPRLEAASPLRIWSVGDGWQAQQGTELPAPLRPGQSWRLEGVAVEVVEVEVLAAGAMPTVRGGHQPLRLVTRHTTVHVQRDGRETVAIDGKPARIVCELAAMGVPAEWSVVASEVWPELSDRFQARELWDRTMRRLRARLREIGVREDLVRPDGRGNVELFLMPGDTLADDG